MSNWRYANQVPTEKWRSAMTLPRELSLTSSEYGVFLIQKPVSEMDTLRKSLVFKQDLTIESNNPLVFNLIHHLMEINVEFEKVSSSYFGMILQYSDTEKIMISYDTLIEKLCVDRTNAGESSFSAAFPTIQEAPLEMNDGRIKLQIFIDTSSVEVFANDGKVVITSLIFPNEPCNKIVLLSNEGSTHVPSLTLTELDSIWV
jgi:fructan beta-fructosidase